MGDFSQRSHERVLVWMHPHDFQTVVLEEIGALRQEACEARELLKSINQQLGVITMGQAEVDAAVAELGVDVQGLTDAGVAIQAEIAALQGQGVDTTGLTAAVAQLDTAVGSIASIATAPPAA